MTIQQFDCVWRGDIRLEPGDRLYILSKDGEEFVTYLLDDVIEYNGALQETTRWKYNVENEDEVESNPTSLGDILKKTTAKVDKANQEITLAVNKVEAQESVLSELKINTEGILSAVEKIESDIDSRLAALELNTDGISASVQQIQSATESRLDAMGNEIETITNRVEATMTPEQVEIKIQEAIGEGANQVTTETGFTFNDVGLTVSKSGSEMTTTITEDGMSVYKNGSEVLTADNTGVKAIDLRAITYLHIGTYSRFQDYDGGRTGCFWIV